MDDMWKPLDVPGAPLNRPVGPGGAQEQATYLPGGSREIFGNPLGQPKAFSELLGKLWSLPQGYDHHWQTTSWESRPSWQTLQTVSETDISVLVAGCWH